MIHMLGITGKSTVCFERYPASAIVTREMIRTLKRIKIILVQPSDAMNVGAVCRAMKTMGIARLTIIRGKPLKEETVKTLAIHAWDVYQKAQFVDTLEEGLNGTVFSAGVTRRIGKWRKHFGLSPEELAEKISQIDQGTTAVVFGSESSGLTNEQLSMCNVAAVIPSSPEFPSLNLSHAVQVIAYALFRRLSEACYDMACSNREGKFKAITRGEMDRLVSHIVECLGEIGFFTHTGRDNMYRFIRDLLSRALVDEEEAGRIEKLFRRVRDLKLHFQEEVHGKEEK